MAKSFPPGQCVHCLSHFDNLTSDHVFPRSWYPNSTPDNLEKWQVPACRKCNQDYGKLEEDLLYRIGLCIDGDTDASSGIPEKVGDALNPKRGKNQRDESIRLAKALKILSASVPLTELSNFEIHTKDPAKLGAPIDIQQLTRFCKKIVRGLIWLELNRFIDTKYKICVDVMAKESPDFDALIELGQIYTAGPGLEVKWNKTIEDPICGVFAVKIFGLIKLHAWVIPADLKPDNAPNAISPVFSTASMDESPRTPDP